VAGSLTVARLSQQPAVGNRCNLAQILNLVRASSTLGEASTAGSKYLTVPSRLKNDGRRRCPRIDFAAQKVFLEGADRFANAATAFLSAKKQHHHPLRTPVTGPAPGFSFT